MKTGVAQKRRVRRPSVIKKEAMMSMHPCPHCRKELRAGTYYCRHCRRNLGGKPVEAWSALPLAASPATTAPALPAASGAPRMALVLVLLGGMMCLVSDVSSVLGGVLLWVGFGLLLPASLGVRLAGGFVLAMILGSMAISWRYTAPRAPSPSAATDRRVAAAPPRKLAAEIQANIRFSGTQVVVENIGRHDWESAEFVINSGIVDDHGYTFNAGLIEAGKQLTVGAIQFANYDGQRFNPLQLKPQRFRIVAYVDGQLAIWSDTWQ